MPSQEDSIGAGEKWGKYKPCMCNKLSNQKLIHCSSTHSTKDVSDYKDIRGNTTTKMSWLPFSKHNITLEKCDKLSSGDPVAISTPMYHFKHNKNTFSKKYQTLLVMCHTGQTQRQDVTDEADSQQQWENPHTQAKISNGKKGWTKHWESQDTWGEEEVTLLQSVVPTFWPDPHL